MPTARQEGKDSAVAEENKDEEEAENDDELKNNQAIGSTKQTNKKREEF